MDKTMSHTTRKEILQRLRRRYHNAGLEHKRKLLDQAQELLGYHRKSAVRALGAPEFEPAPWVNTGRPVSYEPRRFPGCGRFGRPPITRVGGVWWRCCRSGF